MIEGEKLILVDISDGIKSAYIDYSVSVIILRTLPDVRDGLKLVHRRVLYGIYDMGVLSSGAHREPVAIVGEVLGRHHPYGNAAVYDTMVRVAQYWSLRYMLVDGQGNLSPMGGNLPAVMRHTEARICKFSKDMLSDINKKAVDHQPTYDDSREEPTILPTRIPNLLVNSSAGIVAGVATNMALHNLSEAIDGTIAYIDNNDIEIGGLIGYIRTPGFPTGGAIYGYEGIKEAFKTSCDHVVVRAKTEFQEAKGREYIAATEVPYQVDTSVLSKKTSNLVEEDKPKGITDVRDESARGKIYIAYFLERDAVPNVVLNNLSKCTELQTSFSVNNITLVKGRPELSDLKDPIYHFVEHRHEVVYRRTGFESRKARERIHILEGSMKVMATENIMGKAIEIIRFHDKPKGDPIAELDLTDVQVKAILALALHRINKALILQTKEEYEQKLAKIRDLEDILARKECRVEATKQELLEIKGKYGDEHRSVIEYAGGEFSVEDMISDDKIVITISHTDYIKRTPLSECKARSRGGVGQRAFATRDRDFLGYLSVSLNYQYLLFFTQKDKCSWVRVYEIPESSKAAKGRVVQNLINIGQDDKIKAFVSMQNLKDKGYVSSNYLIVATRQGITEKTLPEKCSRLRQNGINVIIIKEGDELIEAKLTSGNSRLMLAVKSGHAIRPGEDEVRVVGCNSQGVCGVDLGTETDGVVSMMAIENPLEETILVVSKNGYGEHPYMDDPETREAVHCITNRGGKGVKAISTIDRTGQLVAIKGIAKDEGLMAVNKFDIVVRLSVDTLRVSGRATRGVRLANIKDKDSVAAVTKMMKEDDNDNNATEEVGVFTEE